MLLGHRASYSCELQGLSILGILPLVMPIGRLDCLSWLQWYKFYTRIKYAVYIKQTALSRTSLDVSKGIVSSFDAAVA